MMRRCLGGLLLLCWVVTGDLVRTIDGDTFVARLAIWHGLTVTAHVRVLGVDTPERGQAGFAAATQFAHAWLQQGAFTVTTCERDSFGRVLGRVTRDQQALAQALREAELGVVYRAE